MFHRAKNAAAPGARADDVPEWGETESGTTASEPADAQPADAVRPHASLEINTLDFPAMRMAYRTDDVEEHSDDGGSVPVARPEPLSYGELTEEERLPLLRRLAEMDDEEGEATIPAPDAASSVDEMLPELFRHTPGAADSPDDGGDEEETEEADPLDVIESEREKQQQISDELYCVIDRIETQAADVVQRCAPGASRKAEMPADPYNVCFNTRYDDTDEVLQSIAEIPLGNDYFME